MSWIGWTVIGLFAAMILFVLWLWRTVFQIDRRRNRK